jgi:hypothetical protein
MPLDPSWLPEPTPPDPAEDPPGSIDPLGTLADAERLAAILLPGFTVRMRRARLLTFAAVAAEVAERTVARMGNREDLRLEARLAFERLFVSAVVRMVRSDPKKYGKADRGLPGKSLAVKAMEEGEPLTRANFLKGQAVNGPFGVIASLARQMELIDDDGLMGGSGEDVLMAWSGDEKLPGVLDEDGDSKRDGAKWMADVVKCTVACVENCYWPGEKHRIWELLAEHLRPDKPGPRERDALLRRLKEECVRRRVLGLLKERVDVYRQAQKETDDRGKQERAVLLRGIRPQLCNDSTDRLIAAVIEAADAYEQASGLLQQAFEGLVWALKTRGGRARPEDIIQDARVRRHLEKTASGLRRIVPRVDRAVERLRNQPSINPNQLVDPIRRLREDVLAASKSEKDLADTVLRRHERVQKEKGKAPWIERESHWTLMPGENRVSADAPPIWQDTYLHPFKIDNAYSLLNDLGQVAIDVHDAEA